MTSLNPPDIYRTVAELGRAEKRFALATVLVAQGPTPCAAGAKAIMQPDGTICGTVGGGAVEAETRRLAAVAIETQQPLAFDFNLDGADAADTVPVCGGRMRVLVDPTAATHSDVYAAVAEAQQRRQRGVLVTQLLRLAAGTVVRVAFQAEEFWDDQTGTSQIARWRSALEQRRPILIAGELDATEEEAVFIDPVVPKPLLLVLGAGHVGHAVAHQADQVGFEVVVIDDRSEYATPTRFDERIAVHCGSICDQLQRFPLSSDTYVVIVTRNHQQDAEALASCLQHPVAFLGMIGSRRKVEFIKRALLDSNQASAEELERLYAPIGVDIGAVTVPEIATSIVAQLISVRRQGSASRIAMR